MINDWIYIDDIEITDDVKSIHCDTRDFCCLCTDKEMPHEAYYNLKKILDNEKFLIDINDIKNFIKNLETISGGKAKWRFLSFKKLRWYKDSWLKYIRLYRVKNNKFIVTFNGLKGIHIDELTKENLNKKELNLDK